MYVGTQSGCLTDLKAALEGAAMMDGTTAAPESAVDCQGKSAARKARSAANIAKWSTYLPPDCVQSMVRMGWDDST